MPWHKIKAVSTTAAPQHVLSVGISTRAYETSRGEAESRHHCSKWWSVYRRRIRGKWSAPQMKEGTDPAELWKQVYLLAEKGRRLWVMVPHVSDAMGLLHGWKQIENGLLTLPGVRLGDSAETNPKGKKVKRGSVIIGGATEMVIGRIGSNRGWISIVHPGNYSPATLEEIGRSVWDRIPEEWRPVASDGLTDMTGKTQCAVLDTWIASTIDWWVQADAGPWQVTAAKLSHSVWRRKFLTTPVILHDHAEAHQQEREGVYGGRAELYWHGEVVTEKLNSRWAKVRPAKSRYGRISGPLTRIDIRSMYPSILAAEALPVRLMDFCRDPDPSYLEGNNERYGVMATVRLKAAQPDWPHRIPAVQGFRSIETPRGTLKVPYWTPERTCFPTGEFDAVLCGPELRHAVASGAVIRVYRAATYELRPAFSALSQWLWKIRTEAKASGNPVAESMAKLLANAFSGRWAQRPGKWIDCPGVPCEVEWGTWWAVDTADGDATMYRDVCGVTQVRSNPDRFTRGFPAIFAWITSHGRDRIRRLLRACPPRSVIQVDTDGAYLTAAGHQVVKELPGFGSGDMGTIRVVSEHSEFRGWGPRHYWTDGLWTLAGIRAGYTQTDASTLIERVRATSVQSSHGRPDCVRELLRTIHLDQLRVPCRVGPDGWMIPENFGQRTSNPGVDPGTTTDAELPANGRLFNAGVDMAGLPD